MSYQKGDIVWVDFPFTDSSKTKVRPALIISNNQVNNTGDYLLVQITSKVKNDNLSLEILNQSYKTLPLEIRSFIRLHKIFVLNEAMILGAKTTISNEFMDQVIEKITELIK